jgi:hypothetical protein
MPVSGKQGSFSSIQVRDAFMVYKQDAADAQNRGEKIESMGAYMRAALDQGRKPRNTDFDFNRQHAERASKLHPFLEVTKKYVKLLIGDSREEIEFDQPKSQFMRHFDQKVQTAMVYG